MRSRIGRQAVRRGPWAATAVAASAVTATVVLGAPASGLVRQPTLTTRSVPIITADSVQFRDLDRNGRLTPYEDWRLTAKRRTADLLSRMSLGQRAGLLSHASLAAAGQAYDLPKAAPLIADRRITTFITRLVAPPAQLAEANNALQEIAEQQPLAVPLVISSDPRNGFAVQAGRTVQRVGTTAMPDSIGMGAANRPRLTRRLADIVRQEYRAMGIAQSLAPQADLATEPRWDRVNGTFGSDAEVAKAHVRAFVLGMQVGHRGLTPKSVATITKHWAGYGAQEEGHDSHYYFGRFATFPGRNFREHIIPFIGGFSAKTAGIMPTYSILKHLVFEGTAVPQVGGGFNSWLLQELLRGKYRFDGVVLSDWAITGGCPEECRQNRPPAFFIGPWGVGMPWGVEDRTVLERYALAINAGVDQLGGVNEPAATGVVPAAYVVQAVQEGLLSEDRVYEAARRVLQQKFQLGLFESPYVDPATATAVAGNERFKAVGDDAQAASLTLLTNDGRLLPARARAIDTVYVHGVAPEVAQDRGLTVTGDPAQADLAIIRLSDPRGVPDATGLAFSGEEADYKALQAAVNSGVPTVASPKLDRPLVLTNVVDRANAVLANYGVSDEVLLEAIFGERAPRGHLPFELPSSQAAVDAQLEDVPDDSARPLFKRGFGLAYTRP